MWRKALMGSMIFYAFILTILNLIVSKGLITANTALLGISLYIFSVIIASLFTAFVLMKEKEEEMPAKN